VPDVLVVVGARPNFMKAASLLHALPRAGLTYALVHTGQHYDDALSQVFFDELELPRPDAWLGVGSGSHAAQTAGVMLAFEQELLERRPQVVAVVGDVNSTLACALTAVKERIPVAHVEAGLRCFDEWMPEEINRKLTDHISTFLYTTSRDGDAHLRAEGIPASKIAFVGNTMIDTLLRFADAARARGAAERLGVAGSRYGVVTLHRAENVDDPDTLGELVGALVEVSRSLPLVVPLHPRTRARLAGTGLDRALAAGPGVLLTESVGYLDFVGLVSDAALVLTDSGGVQEETTVLGVPCLTLRSSTERPVTVSEGTNRVVGTSAEAIVGESLRSLEAPAAAGRIPELWDGRAGDRIARHLARILGAGDAVAPEPYAAAGRPVPG
jgi:UDP-N-acetylglucosamine 2-epimerase (non-hydrolysing)